MSRGFNRAILMGNLARDPDVRHTPSKQKVARLTLAISRQWKNKVTGELESRADFVPVVAWGALADLCERYLAKGRPALVEGRIQVRDFEDSKTGQRRWVTEVIAENITLLGGSQRKEGAPMQPSRSASGYQSAPQGAYQDFSADDVASFRDQSGFGDDFPLDFSEMQEEDTAGDVDIPF